MWMVHYLLLKSTQYGSNNAGTRNKAFLQLAELNFAKKLYRPAYNFYDSLHMDDPELKDPDAILKRKEILGRIAANMEIIDRQDSLQRIAAMPEEDRRDFVRKLARQLRKAQGLKDEGVITKGSPFAATNTPSLFSGNETKGEWYFYNQNSRAKGASDFKAKWGNRPNIDNWRRGGSLSAIRPGTQVNAPNKKDLPGTIPDDDGEITSDKLYDRLPLTAEMLKESNDSIQSAMFVLGKSYIQDIEDCDAGTRTFEDLRARFPQFNPMDEVLFNLYYCYNRNGESGKAAMIKKEMIDKYGSSNFTTIVATGKNPASKSNNEATKTYEEIYDLFIEGNFTEAIARKKVADSIYSHNFWTPQLLYIEAVYYVRQREDSTAIHVLNQVVSRFPGTPLAVKSANLIKVLGRRNEIEEELRNTVVIMPPVDTTRRAGTYTNQPVVQAKPDSLLNQAPVIPVVTAPSKPAADTSLTKPVQPPPVAGAYAFSANEPHYVILVLNKVDPVFTNEAKNAFSRHNRETYYNKPFSIELRELDAENKLMLISSFKDAEEAVTYVDKTRPRTANEIIPWLKGGKYYFLVITERNLALLMSSKNIDTYKAFLNQHLPGKF